MARSYRALLCLLSLLLLLPPVLPAQSTYTAQLSGVITDSSGGVVPGAKVLLTDDSTGITVTAMSDERGTYTFTALRPDTYTLRVEANNFAAVERKNVVLAVSQQATLDVVVTPGTVSTSVTVTTQAPLLDT